MAKAIQFHWPQRCLGRQEFNHFYYLVSAQRGPPYFVRWLTPVDFAGQTVTLEEESSEKILE